MKPNYYVEICGKYEINKTIEKHPTDEVISVTPLYERFIAEPYYSGRSSNKKMIDSDMINIIILFKRNDSLE